MSLRLFSTSLICLAAAGAPWASGANFSFGWATGVLLAGACLVGATKAVVERTQPGIPWPAISAVVVLISCLAWWITRPAPPFATAFSAQHWEFLVARFPHAIFQWTRAHYLVFLAGVLLGLLAAATFGSSPEFRRTLSWVIGFSGLLVAAYALGIRWLGWPHPPWIQLAGDTERYNVAYFHHNAPGAALNLGWPLLFFGLMGRLRPAWAIAGRLAIMGVVATALPLWHSKTPIAIAVGLLLAAGLCRLFANAIRRRPATLPLATLAIFAVIGSWQWWEVARMRVSFPDEWISAIETEKSAPTRDAAIRAAAEQRGDRLVASPAPSRPAAWLAGARMAADYRWIGLGPGAWLHRSVLYSNDTLVNTFYQHRQFVPHDLLQTAAEWGGLPTLAWLVIWIGAFWRQGIRAAEVPETQLGIFLSLLGVAILSTVHFPLQNPAILLWATLLLGLAWSPNAQSGVNSRSSFFAPTTPSR